MSKPNSTAKARVLQMAETVKVERAPELPKRPLTRPLAVRLPSDLVDLLQEYKEETGVEMSALIRPVLEQAFRKKVPAENSPAEATALPGKRKGHVNWGIPWMPFFVPDKDPQNDEQ